MPKVGVEPTPPCGDTVLNRTCLPVPPLRPLPASNVLPYNYTRFEQLVSLVVSYVNSMDMKQLATKVASVTNITTHKYENHNISTIFALTLARILFPFLIFRRPILAVIASMVVDYLDGFLLNLLSTWTRAQYQVWDKVLDMWWYVIVLVYVVKNFCKRRRNWLIFFFGFRLVGHVLYLLVPREEVFIFFPNYFEAFFIVWLLDAKWKWFRNKMATKWRWVIYLFAFVVTIIREIEIHIGAANFQVW